VLQVASLVTLIVKVRTVNLRTGVSMSAGIQLVVVRMVLLFFPPMTVLTLELIRTSILVTADKLP
jgi:hypothetical protein